MDERLKCNGLYLLDHLLYGGALFGQWISNPEVFGLDFALVAMFIALLVLQLEHVKSDKLKHNLFLIMLMIVFMISLSIFVPSHVAVLLSTVLVATIGVVTSK